MDYIKRRPDFMIEVLHPYYDAKTVMVQGTETATIYGPYKYDVIAQFISSSVTPLDKIRSNACISYTFRESFNTVEDGFSLELTLEQDGAGKTWYDKIKVMDLVFIREFDEVRFAGYIKDIRYSASISGGKPNRRIIISGGSLGDLLASFKLIIDQYIYQGSDTQKSASKKLMVMLAQQQDVDARFSEILKSIYKAFFELVLRMGTVTPAGVGIKNILDYYIDYESGLSDQLLVKYPINMSLFQAEGTSSVWDIWLGLVVLPVNELFGLWNSEREVFQLIFRRSPFDAKDWKNLWKNTIPSILITDVNVGNSVNEVFTYYLGTLPGSRISKHKSIVIMQEEYGQSGIIDEEKWKKYGYRPLVVEYKYFDTSKVEEFTGAVKLMSDLSTCLNDWYSNNDKFLSGSLDIMTIDNREWKRKLKNPRIGEKIGFLGGEFYVESADHSWSFKGPMKTHLSISRGYVYDAGGGMTGEIEDLGMKVKEILKEVV